MSDREQEIIENLVRRGEIPCAMVCCFDWGISLEALEDIIERVETDNMDSANQETQE